MDSANFTFVRRSVKFLMRNSRQPAGPASSYISESSSSSELSVSSNGKVGTFASESTLTSYVWKRWDAYKIKIMSVTCLSSTYTNGRAIGSEDGSLIDLKLMSTGALINKQRTNEFCEALVN